MYNRILKLKGLYCRKSKHAKYQILPQKLEEKIGKIETNIKNTYEYERFEYILKKVNIKDKRIMDIGGNSGFFTFELLDKGAKFVHYYEGDKTLAEFVRLASEILNIENKLKITNKYFSFDVMDDIQKDKYDIVLLLNVLHHIGDDYGDDKISKDIAKKLIISHLNNLSEITDVLIFQLGFNWKGKRNICLFENGTKRELINYIMEGTKSKWEIVAIGIAELKVQKVKYCDLNDINIERDDSLGEFLNRPIFIMKSRSE